MPPDVHRYINATWILVGIYWAAASIRSKATVRQERYATRVLYVAVMGAAIDLLFGSPRFGALGIRLHPTGVRIAWTGLGLVIAGAAIAVWARALLGSNWSGTVTLKRGHELVRRWPYALVRHPIYSGLLLGVLGTALALGELRVLVAFAVAFIGWGIKSATEERFLVDQFDGSYVRYRAEVKRLIPFVY
jgi:protein-S-isoprenylcysteine O-methyltransferase Ste14